MVVADGSEIFVYYVKVVGCCMCEGLCEGLSQR